MLPLFLRINPWWRCTIRTFNISKDTFIFLLRWSLATYFTKWCYLPTLTTLTCHWYYMYINTFSSSFVVKMVQKDGEGNRSVFPSDIIARRPWALVHWSQVPENDGYSKELNNCDWSIQLTLRERNIHMGGTAWIAWTGQQVHSAGKLWR
jgi:hypothetical protein